MRNYAKVPSSRSCELENVDRPATRSPGEWAGSPLQLCKSASVGFTEVNFIVSKNLFLPRCDKRFVLTWSFPALTCVRNRFNSIMMFVFGLRARLVRSETSFGCILINERFARLYEVNFAGKLLLSRCWNNIRLAWREKVAFRLLLMHELRSTENTSYTENCIRRRKIENMVGNIRKCG